jgi:peroxiredoxin
MSASINNIAATFANLQITSSSSSLSRTSFPLSVSQKSISTKWNPHNNLHKSQKSSLINLYGPPGPPPLHSISTVHPHHHKPILSIPIGQKLPNITLSYLNPNDAVKTLTLSSLCRGKKVVFVGVSAAFSPTCTRFLKRVESEKSRGSDLIACVAVNDVFVMRAWGESMAVGEKVMMVSDGCGELSRVLGVSLDLSAKACLGIGVRSMRFCLSSFNGVITNVNFDDEEENFVYVK